MEGITVCTLRHFGPATVGWIIKEFLPPATFFENIEKKIKQTDGLQIANGNQNEKNCLPSEDVFL